MEKKRILLVEDHTESRNLLHKMLSQDYDVQAVEQAVIGIDQARNTTPDLIIMDVVLPILSGLDACSLLKKDDRTKRIPIILMSVRNSQADITHGLAVGADDYLPKPFDLKEFIARVHARVRSGPDPDVQPIQMGDLYIEPANRTVMFGGKAIKLTLTEFDILRFLATKNSVVVSRDDIIKEVWKQDTDKANDRTIDVHIRALRRKIPELTKHIISIYGVGYKYEK